MNFKNLLLAHTTILLISACSSSKIISNADHTVDFSSYQSFLIMERLESDKIKPEAKKYIGNVIAEELKKRGLKQNLSPDIIVKVMIISKEKQAALITRNDDFYWGSEYYPYGWGIGTNVNKVSYDTYTDGTMIIDVIDREKKQLIWQGISSDAFKGSTQKNQSKIKKMISNIFNEYPLEKK